ncbi:expressed unknown protein [Seminavis robusta]|uniref:Uncharacterized protein n=1 Tax=Seminavis robusta TaxID=568900 RepID=A0A9N8EVN3_9STRA|nr:expressed unknown protein [Seminavis robusta]|eukprot:Sro2146_g316450.1 n/a (183) ;mRNA; f:15273-15821
MMNMNQFLLNLPANVTIVVDNAAGHSLAAKLEEDRRREKEARMLQRYMDSLTVEDDDDDDYSESSCDSETEFDMDDSTSMSQAEQEFISSSWRWTGQCKPVARTPPGSPSACTPKRPERKQSENSATLDLSDDQKQTLMSLYSRSISQKKNFDNNNKEYSCTTKDCNRGVLRLPAAARFPAE